MYRGAPIFFGLGNFLFHLNEGEAVWSAADVWKSVVATCRFDADSRLQSIDLLPIIIGGERMMGPKIIMSASFRLLRRLGAEMIRDLAARSRSHGVSIDVEGANEMISGRLRAEDSR